MSKTISQAPGGQETSPTGAEALIADSNSGAGPTVYMLLSTLLTYINANASIGESQVAGLTASLAGKSGTSHNHTGVYQPVGSYLTEVTEADVTQYQGNFDIAAIPAPATMSNYTPVGATIDGHFAGIDNKLDATLPARGANQSLKVTANKTLANTDLGDRLGVDSTGAITITIPLQASNNWPSGAGFEIWRLNTGTVTIRAASGATLNGVNGGSVTIPERWQGVALTRWGTDEWAITNIQAA